MYEVMSYSQYIDSESGGVSPIPNVSEDVEKTLMGLVLWILQDELRYK